MATPIYRACPLHKKIQRRKVLLQHSMKKLEKEVVKSWSIIIYAHFSKASRKKKR